MTTTTDWDARVGVFIRERRVQLGASQAQLAEALSAQGIAWHRMTATKVELGDRRLYADELPTLCKTLRIGIEQFFNLIPDSVEENARHRLTRPHRNPLMEAS